MISLVWGDTAPVLASLIVARPALASRLVFAPRRVMHALAAYVQHARAAHHADEEIAAEVEQQHVRTLLSRAIPDAHPRLLRMLGRMELPVADLRVYLRLNETLHGPASDLIQTAVEVTESRIATVAEIVADPVLTAGRKALGWSAANIDLLQHALMFLRATRLAHDIEMLPQGSGWRAILRRISSDLGRARAPTVPFDPPAGWRHIQSVADLWQVGGTLGNCVADLRSGGEGYIAGLITGEAVFLAHDGEPIMLACIRRVSGPNFWVLSETTMSSAGSNVMETRQVLHAALTKTIEQAGGALLDQSPLAAISAIAWRAERAADVDELEDAA